MRRTACTGLLLWRVRDSKGTNVLVFIYYHPAGDLTNQSLARDVHKLALSSSTADVVPATSGQLATSGTAN